MKTFFYIFRHYRPDFRFSPRFPCRDGWKNTAFILFNVSFIINIHNCKRKFTGISVVKHFEVIVRQGLAELGSGNAQCRQVNFHAFCHILVIVDRSLLASYLEVTVKRTGAVNLPDSAAVGADQRENTVRVVYEIFLLQGSA